MEKLSSPDDDIIINPISVEAKALIGMVSDYATVTLDIQFKRKNRGEELIKEIRQLAKSNLDSKLNVRTKKAAFRPPVQETEKNIKFFEIVQNLANRLEVRVKPIHRITSSDVCYVPEEIPVLDGFGPIGGGTNSPNEYILSDSLIDRAVLLTMLIDKSARE